ncbi:unnamed protein product [Rhodiola kirilowii]
MGGCPYADQADLGFPHNSNKSVIKSSSAMTTDPFSDTCLVDFASEKRLSDNLAERVRGEKISGPIKLLHELVVGCNKVTGEAAMLDEIIDYVQSLQYQVEHNNMSEGSLDQSSEQGDKEQNLYTSLQNKQSGEHTKVSSQTEDDTEDTYINVRARRGQATDRRKHNLVERVQVTREKINERILHELVPGYNEIACKAVIFDEVINSMQSLQHQVEFLTMKLAGANQELNIDKEQIVSKDMAEKERTRDMSEGSLDRPCEQDITEQHQSRDLQNMQYSKQTEGSSQTEDDTKDTYIARARRGQATDSQSLAERVRKEKISECMKMLHELVLGCDKVNIEEMLSKGNQILRSQGDMQDIPNSAAQYHHMPQVHLKENDTSEVEHLKKQLEHANVEKAEIQRNHTEQVSPTARLLKEIRDLREEAKLIRENPERLCESVATCKDMDKDVMLALQRNHAEQVSLNTQLLKEIKDLREEAILIHEVPKRLRESVATCKDIYKDVMLALEPLCASNDSPTAKVVSCTSEVGESLFSALETHLSVAIQGSEISGENDYSGQEKLKSLGERLRQTATSLAVTIGEDMKCAVHFSCRKDELATEVNNRGADGISMVPSDEECLGNDDLMLTKLNQHVDVEVLRKYGKLHNVIKDLKHVKLDGSVAAQRAALVSAIRHLTSK